MTKFYTKVFTAFFLCLFLSIYQRLFAQFPKEVEIIKEKKGKLVEIWASNRNTFPVTVFFSKGEKFKNCIKDTTDKKDTLFIHKRISIAPKTKRIHLYTLFPKDTNCVCNAHLYWDIFRNDFAKDTYKNISFDYPYLLPFDYDKYILVSQGYFGWVSHAGLYALDFVMPENTRISASRAGVVLEVKQDSKEGGFEKQYLNKSNFIKILHSDNTVAIYGHLRYGGVVVHEGQHIQRGQHIGYSGNTGYSSGAHLHFSVYSNKDKQSIPTKFRFGKFIMYLSAFDRYYRYIQKNPQKIKAK